MEDNDPNGMEMPCLCECGKWFDLNDGYISDKRGVRVCDDCHIEEEEAMVPDEEDEVY